MSDKFDFRKKINFDIYRTGLRTHLCGELGKTMKEAMLYCAAGLIKEETMES